MVEKLRKELLYCQREHLEKFDYAQLDTGLPPVQVNAFDDDCKRPILKLYEKLDERYAGKAPAVDKWLGDTALLSDSLFMLSGMLKNLGTRRLSALVARMKEVQAEALSLAETVRKAELPMDEAAWKSYADDLGARFAGADARFEALKGELEGMLGFFEERILANVKKEQMVYYLTWEHRLDALRLTRQALSDAARSEVVRIAKDEVAGQAPLLAGAGAASTREAVERSYYEAGNAILASPGGAERPVAATRGLLRSSR